MPCADRALIVLLCSTLSAACSSGEAATTASSSSSSASSSSSGGGAGGAPAETPIGGDRPVTVEVPSSVKPDVPAPLVIMLHGYSVNGVLEEIYLQLAPLAKARGFLYAHPDGTVNKDGKHFWNATDACCDRDGSGVDDSGYLAQVIKEIKARYNVDPRRVYLVGHSNGGFMSYRMACDHAEEIAAVATLAGAMFADVSRCKPSAPVSILQIHGTADTEVLYEGTTMAPGYPSAATTVKDWAELDGCASTPDTSAPPLDLDVALPGAETRVERYAQGCKPGGGAELWSIQDGLHIPALSADFREKLIDFLYAHPKP
jgi:polyhydroxybutyrate depolymerase